MKVNAGEQHRDAGSRREHRLNRRDKRNRDFKALSQRNQQPCILHASASALQTATNIHFTHISHMFEDRHVTSPIRPTHFLHRCNRVLNLAN